MKIGYIELRFIGLYRKFLVTFENYISLKTPFKQFDTQIKEDEQI